MKNPQNGGYEKGIAEIARRYVLDVSSEAFVYLKDCEDTLGKSKAQSHHNRPIIGACEFLEERSSVYPQDHE